MLRAKGKALRVSKLPITSVCADEKCRARSKLHHDISVGGVACHSVVGERLITICLFDN